MEYATVIWNPSTEAKQIYGNWKWCSVDQQEWFVLSSVLSMLQQLKWPTFQERRPQAKVTIIYQSPLILTELFQHSLINVSYLTACYLHQVMMTLHFLNDVANDTESTQK